jgi:putative colanic acid biosynthesis acetyltransferase WcaF
MGNIADDPRLACAPPTESADAEHRVIDLSLAGKGNYRAGRSALVELLWFVVEACVINNKLLPLSSVRVALLRLFGARIGTGCRFVHPLRVKAPWNLEEGDSAGSASTYGSITRRRFASAPMFAFLREHS